MDPKEYFSEASDREHEDCITCSEESESDHENCSTCSEEEKMSEDETPTTSDEEFIVSDAEMEEEDEFEELIEENEKLRKEIQVLKLLIQKKCKTVGQQNLSQGVPPFTSPPLSP